MKSTNQSEQPRAACLLPAADSSASFAAVRLEGWVLPALFAAVAGAQGNAAMSPLVAPPLPGAGVFSLIRVAGALALVIGIFLGGVWLIKNYQRLALQNGRAPKLRVLENRSLGGRHGLFVVGYEQERFLIASSPGGVTLLSHLPAAAEAEPGAGAAAPPSFPQALAQVLKGK